MLKMVDGTGIIGVDMVCPLGGTVSPPQPPNFDKVEMEGVGSLMLPNSLEAPVERVELIGNSVQPTTTGKNLFDESKAVTGRINPDNGELLPETSYISSDYIEVQEGETYFQSGSGDGYYRAFYDMNKKFTSIPTKGIFKITVPVGSKFLRISGRKERFGDWMIEKGDKATPYEPYTGLKSSPSPEYPQEIKSAGKWNEGAQKYEIDVKVTGKNLLNLQKESDVKGTYQGWKVGDGKKTIVLSIKDKGNNVDITKCSIGVSGNGINPNDGLGWIVQDGTILRSEIKTTNPYVTIYPPNETAVQKFLDRFEIQVEYGTTATPYEPYTEQSMQIALDEPLRGIGEYKDVLTKDGGVRKIKRIVFDENTPFKEYNAPVQVKTTSFISGTTIKDATGETGIEVMSDRFKAKDRGFDRYDEECITLFGKNIFVRFNKDKNINTAEALTEWLKQNPLTVDYVLAEPVTEPLPESVQAQLSSLHSENGTTHVFVDSGEVPCGIKLTYRKEI